MVILGTIDGSLTNSSAGIANLWVSLSRHLQGVRMRAATCLGCDEHTPGGRR